MRQIRGVLNSKLLRFFSSNQIDNLTKCLAEVFIMSGGDLKETSLSFIHHKEMELSVKLHPGGAINSFHDVFNFNQQVIRHQTYHGRHF